MRHSLVLLVLLTFFIFGCAENSSLVNPVTDSNNPEWVSLHSNSLAKKGDVTFSKVIDPDKGGKINFKLNDDISIKGKLVIPKNAFEGDPVEFVVDLSGEFATVTFGPSGFAFNPDLSFTIEYKGVELEDWDNIQFGYFDDVLGFVADENADVTVDAKKGVLKAEKVSIGHFSRYGFTR